jgi:mannan endo-1,4-beta-mannosidase
MMRLAWPWACGALCTTFFALLLTGCGAGPQSISSSAGPAAATAAPTLATPMNVGPLIPSTSIYFGAYPNPSGLGNGDNPSAVAAFESQLGRKLAINLHFVGFTTLWPNIPDLDDVSNGRMSLELWDCGISDAQIVAGTADPSLQARAQAVAAFGRPIMISFFYEMNVPAGIGPHTRTTCYDSSTDLSNNAFSPAEFVAAWQHIHTIFDAAGATNAIWVWTVAASSAGGAPVQDPRPYYPGDSEVDWVGIDDWDFGNLTVSQTFNALYNLVAPFGKPILVAQTGAAAPNQNAFFQSMVSTLQSQFPQIKGFMYYDNLGPTVDWRVVSSAFPAFGAMANDPYMSASVPPQDFGP